MTDVDALITGLSNGAKQTVLWEWGRPHSDARGPKVLVTETMKDRTYQELIDAGLLEPCPDDGRDYWLSDLGIEVVGALIQLRAALEATGDYSITHPKRFERWNRQAQKVANFGLIYGLSAVRIPSVNVAIPRIDVRWLQKLGLLP